MMLAGPTSNQGQSAQRLGLLLLSALLFWLGYYLFRPHQSGATPSQATEAKAPIFCGAENREGAFFENSGNRFGGADRQSNRVVRSGQFALELPKSETAERGMIYTFDSLQAGQLYRASVWRYRVEGGKTGALVVEGKGNHPFMKKAQVTNRSIEEWEELLLFFKIPESQLPDSLQVYVTSQGQYLVYFDDLSIRPIQSTAELLEHPDWQQLNLLLGQDALQQLEDKRMEAYRAGILETEETDWVKAKIQLGDSTNLLKATLRLKGDWLDHLEAQKFSYRIRLKGNDVWNRLRTFSLHTPSARSFLKEYILHRFFEKEGILSPRYDFVQVAVNGADRG
ncbi:MAG: hypothetical protein AAGD05_18215, partial [Bacteroidota bacterium]